MIHEFVHAAISKSGSTILNNHDYLASQYVKPMAEYLQSAYNLSIADAYSLAWGGVQDSSVFASVSNDTMFTFGSTGVSLSKGDIMTGAMRYNDYNTFKIGIPICK